MVYSRKPSKTHHKHQIKHTYFNNTNHDTSSDSNPDPIPDPDPDPDPDPEPDPCDDPLDDPPSESKSESSSSTILRITPLSNRSRAKRRAGRRKWWLSRMPRVLRKRWVWWKRSGDFAFILGWVSYFISIYWGGWDGRKLGLKRGAYAWRSEAARLDRTVLPMSTIKFRIF